jgi:hypothetical protein
MRNFPHQVNQIPKIRGALGVAAQLLEEGRDVGDDGVFGYAVTRGGIYKFRNLPFPSKDELEAMIRREMEKTLSNQGPRTFARDLRRTLHLLGFLEHDVGVGWRMSQSGQRIVVLPDPPDAEATSIWVDAMMNLSLPESAEEGSTSHPARNMLRIVYRKPGLEKRWLAFALDMSDDSDAELERVLALQSGSFARALHRVGASEYMAANAVKIIPSIWEQLGLLSIQEGSCNLTPSGLALVNIPYEVSARPSRLVRQGRSGHIVASSSDVPERTLAEGRIRSTEEQLHTAALLDERTSLHQELIKRIVDLLKNSGQVSEIRVSDDAFDILALMPARSEALLIEAKTVKNDALVQARIALGQVLFYEYFDVRPMTEGSSIRRIVAFDNDPGEQARQFLEAYDVSCLVVSSEIVSIPVDFEHYFRIA